MNKQGYVDVSVGLFMLLGLCALLVMALKVSSVSDFLVKKEYTVTADFTDIGGLKVRAPVTVAGVRIGEVSRIDLQPGDLIARVTMRLRSDKRIPYEDSSARILTEGLIGSNYVSIVPGFDDESNTDHPYLKNGDVIAKTQEAVILENLIGQLLFNINKK
ncbi:MAG: outer membrane lipid asymmetry maintenance protein MlaD [Legionella sp.]|nr:MAG: outer membrane lipid asymmetry maintenance protein MlaD [Legionella sp.]PJD99591.1 MAG: outer membrane lipid asymmetry maintenance protein MlaD [Legionella sp.]